MKSTKHIAAFAAVAAFAVAGVTATAVARDDGKLKAESFIGVPIELTGPTGAIRGLNGGGAAWAIGESKVSVKSSGKVDVKFEDLVFASGGNTGRNTVTTMRVMVSCLDATLQTVNVFVGAVPRHGVLRDRPKWRPGGRRRHRDERHPAVALLRADRVHHEPRRRRLVRRPGTLTDGGARRAPRDALPRCKQHPSCRPRAARPAVARASVRYDEGHNRFFARSEVRRTRSVV